MISNGLLGGSLIFYLLGSVLAAPEPSVDPIAVQPGQHGAAATVTITAAELSKGHRLQVRADWVPHRGTAPDRVCVVATYDLNEMRPCVGGRSAIVRRFDAPR